MKTLPLWQTSTVTVQTLPLQSSPIAIDLQQPRKQPPPPDRTPPQSWVEIFLGVGTEGWFANTTELGFPIIEEISRAASKKVKAASLFISSPPEGQFHLGN